MNNAMDIAKYILTLMEDDAGDLISHLKLQKLLYYTQGFGLALLDRPVFGERIVAWQHGPVVPAVWEEFKGYGSDPIPKPEGFNGDVINADSRGVINEVYTVYGQFSAWKLRNMTHDESPWKDVRVNEEITHAALKAFFDTQIVQ